MKHAQHAAHNPKFEKDGIIQTYPVVAKNRLKEKKKIKGPAHMVEGDHHPRNRPSTLGTTSVDFYHNPVTLWAYSTPQPNTDRGPRTHRGNK